MEGGFGFPFGGDPEDLLRGIQEFAAKQAASGLPTPEAMRRLQQSVLTHQVGQLQDDATMLFVEWLTGSAQRMEPDD